MYTLEELREMHSNWDFTSLSFDELKVIGKNFWISETKVVAEDYTYLRHVDKASRLLKFINDFLQKHGVEDCAIEKDGESDDFYFRIERPKSIDEYRTEVVSAIAQSIRRLEAQEKSRLNEEKAARDFYKKLKKRFEK